MKHISSHKNKLITENQQLSAKSRLRKKTGRFVVEGLNEIRLGIHAGVVPEAIIYNPESVSVAELTDRLSVKIQPYLYTATAGVMGKIAYRQDVENAIMLAKEWTPPAILQKIPDQYFLLIAEGIEKPGNIGALLRTADALGINGLILTDPKTDLLNPNVIRSSVGSVFAVATRAMDNDATYRFLKENEFHVYTTFMSTATAAWDVEFTGKTAIILGEEHSGLSEFWRREEFKNINIPMVGKVDSLNVSVASALLSYEVIRQKNTGERK